jgi:hypothetical protein
MPRRTERVKGTRTSNKGTFQGTLVIYTPLLLFPFRSVLLPRVEEALSLQGLLD